MEQMHPGLSDLVKWQLPESIRTPENSQFLALLKHYYDWLTAKGQPTDIIHSILEYRDIDLTDDGFRDHITASLLDINQRVHSTHLCSS